MFKVCCPNAEAHKAKPPLILRSAGVSNLAERVSAIYCIYIHRYSLRFVEIFQKNWPAHPISKQKSLALRCVSSPPIVKFMVGILWGR